jgi:hypothetical protein
MDTKKKTLERNGWPADPLADWYRAERELTADPIKTSRRPSARAGRSRSEA